MSDMTKGKREAEEAARMVTVVRDSNDAITIQDFDGNITAWNHGAELMFGYSEQEALKMTIWQLALPNKAAEQKDFNRRLFAGEKITSFETQRLTKDGRLLDVWLTVTKLVDDAGKVIGIASTERDITVRKREETALRESEDVFKYVFNNSPIGKSITFPSGEIHVNKAFCDTLGYSPQDLKSKKWQDISHPEDIEPTQRFLNTLVSGEKDEVRFVKRYFHKNGSIIWADVSTALRRDEQGKPRYFMTSVVDITVRKRVEETLISSEERFRTAAESLTDVIYDWDIKEKVDWYGGIDGIMGYPPGEFPRTIEGWAVTIHPEDKERVMAALEGHLKGIAPYAIEYRVVRKDGEWRWWSARGTALRDDRGKPYKMIGAITDITERKRIEEVARLSSREAQEKNAELERFLYTVSHDLKSPVVTVRTFLGYLEHDVAAANAEKIEKDLSFIRAAADKMAQLLDSILEISRIGRVVAQPVCITLRTLVDEALSAVAGSVAERGVRIKVADRDLTLYGDRNRLAEIWQNLVENAVKFMGDQPAPCIEIGVEAREAETVFFVRDNGIGIEQRYQAKIFGLFEKLNGKTEGTGIGLAIVKRIVELYGGRVWVESVSQGRGACFCFNLPGAINKSKEGEKI
jgi:PAS domain S-box-containing protein